jgi:uncharacterized membrane protein
MKLISNVIGFISLILVAVGLFLLLKLGLFGTDLATSILALIAAPCLSLGLYVFGLRQRIASLEKSVRELAPDKRVPELT